MLNGKSINCIIVANERYIIIIKSSYQIPARVEGINIFSDPLEFPNHL
jgi:hypothetical protein